MWRHSELRAIERKLRDGRAADVRSTKVRSLPTSREAPPLCRSASTEGFTYCLSRRVAHPGQPVDSTCI